MNLLDALFKTSIGKKVVMAITGLILVGFIFGHMIGNLQIFSAPEKINAYAHFLQGLGGALWLIRGFLLLTVVLHIVTAVKLVLENKAALGPEDYAKQRTLRASFASRTMKWSGLIVLAFIVYHILHFTVKNTHGEAFYPMTELHGEIVPDVHSMMVYGFQQPIIAISYLVAVGLLSVHIGHGISSLFQSLGLRTRAWGCCLNKAAIALAVIYFLGNAAIVAGPLSGKVKIQNEKLIAEGKATACAVCSGCDEESNAN